MTDAAAPPALLSQKQAAAFYGISVGSFRKLVASGHAPQPVALPIRRRLWSRQALEAAAGGNSDDDWARRRDAWRRSREDRASHSR